MSDSGSHRILIVDDEEPNIRLFARILEAAGYTEIRTTTDSRRVLPLFREFAPDIVLLDLRMPYLDGFAIMRQIRSRLTETDFLPFLVITGDDSPEVKQQALTGGANDFLAKPFDKTEVVLRVRNLLNTRDLHQRLEQRVRERTQALRDSEIEIAKRLALAAELRDYRDASHTEHVGVTAAAVALEMGLAEEEVEIIRRAAPLHDIGKIAIPDSILLKPTVLTADEMAIVKTHTTLGAKMLAGSASKILQCAEEVALYHHENYDGTGYTPGLGGDSIPLVGRIVAVADVCDALLRDRPYKQAWPLDDALSWIESERGRKFDPGVVDAFMRVQRATEVAQVAEPVAEATGRT